MTAYNEQQRFLGGYGDLLIEGMRVVVQILDVRRAYGRRDLKVTPHLGSGTKWVNHARIINVRKFPGADEVQHLQLPNKQTLAT